MPPLFGLTRRRTYALLGACALWSLGSFAYCAPAESENQTPTDEAGPPSATRDASDDADDAPSDAPGGWTAQDAPDAGAEVTSIAHAANGSCFVAGTFAGTLHVEGFSFASHGLADAFLLKTHGDGCLANRPVALESEVAWARSVGSTLSEGPPNATVQDDVGTVTLVGTTQGDVDCGRGPMRRWSNKTFYVCVFAQRDGALLASAVFPVD